MVKCVLTLCRQDGKKHDQLGDIFALVEMTKLRYSKSLTLKMRGKCRYNNVQMWRAVSFV